MNDSRNSKGWNILLTVLKWYFIIAFFPFSLLVLYFYSQNKKRREAQKKEYEETAYFAATQVSYDNSRRQVGVRGEYLLYEKLRFLESLGAKFLFNAYIPKPDGTTTELDMICVCSRGVFVFESKDYSGWIFGNENQREWTQTHSSRYSQGGVHKQRFYNPVMQNRAHVRYLRSFLKVGNDFPIWSVVVFSNGCELKQVEIHSDDVFVVQRHEVGALVNALIDGSADVLNEYTIDRIYQILYPLTQVNDEVKSKHNADIRQYPL